MRIGMHPLRVQIGQIREQCIENVGRLVGAVGNKAAEERDVVVGDVPVGDTADLAIADMVLGHEIVFIDFKMRPIGHRRFPGPPLADQLELQVKVDEICRRRPQVRNVELPRIGGGGETPPFRSARPSLADRADEGMPERPGQSESFRFSAINASIWPVKGRKLLDMTTEASMAQLIVRDLSEDLVKALKQRAAKRNRSTEQEHREILQSVLRGPKRRQLADVLAAIPNVGKDSDFEREQTDKRR